ncbi:DUF1304 domain-containing protein [Microbacterium telephonicum]|uniref:Putative membrane protein n=1 Tax=Microbacterium telephonicum TaxID=1714841 RepID=A0A498BZA6_9MICO|nr:DUF1304 domain-containing protein [Microbacterium telephonicum]RLK48089.1 putative membrane protein [Microbacterium telephonicum]
MIATLATLVAALAAALHVYIFAMESITWRTPATWKRFGVADQAAADTTAPMAYNQGFYNLFLAIGTIVGLVLFAIGGDVGLAGRVLAIFSVGSMLAAAIVLTTSGRRYLRAAAIQGTLPLIAVVLLIFA